MTKTSLKDVKFYNTKTIVDLDGNLCPIESSIDIPFEIKRIYYVYGVRDKAPRGKHAHYKTQQLLICVSGKVEVVCRDEKETKKYLLESPQQALFIPKMIWDEQIYISENSVLLALADTNYDSTDYIHDFEQYKNLRNME